MTLGRRTAFTVSAAAGAMMLGGPAGLRAQAGMRLDLSTTWPDEHLHTRNCKLFATEVGKVTNGAVQITVHAGGTLGFKGPEHLDAVRDGLVAMADFLDTQQAGDAPLLGIEAVPFLVANLAELKILQKHARPEFDKLAAGFNQKILYVVPWPAQYLLCSVRTDALDGLKGLRVRVADRQAGEMVSLLGMAAAQLAWSETVAALASGSVAGLCTSAVSAVDGKLWEFLKVFYTTHHAWSSQLLTINLDTWKKISPRNQQAIIDLAARLQPTFWQASMEADRNSAQRLIEGGMQRLDVPPGMLKDMRARTAPLEAAFVGRAGPVAGDVIAAYKKEAGLA